MLALSRIMVLIMMKRHSLPDHTAEENPFIAAALHERKNAITWQSCLVTYTSRIAWMAVIKNIVKAKYSETALFSCLLQSESSPMLIRSH